MAEFGKQLRKAREEKGMTHQSLAEKVYVTRQTVSRWEGGERYPDLVTVKKIAQVLEVDAGFLLSDDETQHIVERNPVVEKQAVNNVTLVLFAGIVISYIISLVGILIRIPSMLSVTASDVWVLGGNAVSELIGIAAFVAGFVWILKGAFSPKKVGAVMMAFLASVCIKGLSIITTGAVVANWFVAVIPVVIGVIGFVASYFCFWKNQPAVIWHRLVTIVSVIDNIIYVCTDMQMSIEPDESVIEYVEIPVEGSSAITAFARISDNGEDYLICLIGEEWYKFIAE